MDLDTQTQLMLDNLAMHHVGDGTSPLCFVSAGDGILAVIPDLGAAIAYARTLGRHAIVEDNTGVAWEAEPNGGWPDDSED